MKEKTYNIYLTIYRECSKEDLKEIFKDLEFDIDSIEEGRIKFFEDNETGNAYAVVPFEDGIYWTFLVKPGRQVDDPLLTVSQMMAEYNFIAYQELEDNPEEGVIIGYNEAITCIKSYMSVICDNKDGEVEQVLDIFELAHKKRQVIRPNKGDFYYEFDKNFVTVFGTMRKYFALPFVKWNLTEENNEGN